MTTALTDRPRSTRRRGRSRNIVAIVAYAIVILFILDAFLWRVIVPHDPLHQNLLGNLKGPGHGGGLFGTDSVGRDEFSRVLAGVAPVLQIVAGSVAIGSLIGLLYGTLAGVAGGWVGVILARFLDVMLSIPGIVFAILLAFVLRPGISTSIIVISVVTWPAIARLVRAEIIRVRRAQYVELGRVAGLTRSRTVSYHVLPNILNTFIAFVVLDAVAAVQLEAGISFLGYGVQPPRAELGSMLASSLTYLNQWWLAFFPGLALTILIVALSYIGQDLRDRLDPRLAERSAAEAEAGRPAAETDAAPTAEESEPALTAAGPDAGTDRVPLDPAGVVAEAEAVLRLRDLTVEVERTGRRIVDDVSLDVRRGHSLAIVGESGSGKSTLCLALLDLLPSGLRAASGRLECQGEAFDLAAKSSGRRLRGLRGRGIGLVLQDPLASLDPVRRIGFQLGETRVTHGLDRRWGSGARAARVAWQDRRLRSLGFTAPDRVRHAVPAALSGGMRQRVCIGIASSADPPVLIADEPTTALDASLRGRVLRLLTEAGRDERSALVLVSHDLSIVRTVADDVMVMYGGMVLEQGPTETVFAAPKSPYTVALLSCSITLDQAEEGAVIPTIDEEGHQAAPAGCPFAVRCPLADETCWGHRPPLTTVEGRHRVACWHSDRADQTIVAAGSGVSDGDG